MSKNKHYSHWVLALIGYSLIVFLWGAWVRISGSGDGCGDHWPLCHGVLLPDSDVLKLWIENFHRISTKAYGFFVMALIFFAFRWFEKGHATRFWIVWVFIFTLIEGLIGAIIVLKGFVADDQSPQRAIFISVHLANTFLLMGILALTWWTSKFDLKDWSAKPLLKLGFSALISALILVGATGALAALSTTLFPSDNLWEGLAKDFSAGSHFLLKLRISHPLLALVFLMAGFYWGFQILEKSKEPQVIQWTKVFLGCLLSTFLIGALTLGMLSPVFLKLTHLLMAHCLWLSLVFYCALWGRRQKCFIKL